MIFGEDAPLGMPLDVEDRWEETNRGSWITFWSGNPASERSQFSELNVEDVRKLHAHLGKLLSDKG